MLLSERHSSKNEACGWRCANGDLLKVLITLIRRRTAPVHFSYIKKEIAHTHGHLLQAKSGASQACNRARADSQVTTLSNMLSIAPTTVLSEILKVTVDIPDDSAMPEAPAACTTRPVFPEGHRGRDKLATLKETNRKKVMEATSSGIFWKEIKKLADDKPAPISITTNSLRDVFEKRLNLPEVLPTQFDSVQHGINIILAKLLPAETVDNTPEGFFMEKWNEDDMGRLKDHLRKHSLDSS
ncbi:hypothetical protein C8R44DRAFT_599644, partial [Mycena epipterygia]